MLNRKILAILCGGLFVGVLDVFVASVLFHVSPHIVLKSIASGVLGRGAFKAGMNVEALGLGLHLFICLVVAAIYVFASDRLPVLLKRPVVCGLALGFGMYFVMNYVVVPLSNAHSGPFDLTMFGLGLADHIVLVGLPIALIAAWFLAPRALGAPN